LVCASFISGTFGQTSWSSQDIGNPAIAGSASATASGFTITAGGSDIWGTADQFYFVYQQISGDVDVRARVDSITYSSSWAKAGVMIRGSLAADAAHGFTLVSAGKGTAFQRRTLAGGSSTSTGGVVAAAPEWVRLVRQGSTVSSYTSPDGVAWTLISSDTIQLPTVTYVGLAVSSHNTSGATTASLSQISVMPVGLPAGQQDADIGSPPLPGAAAYSNGTYRIHAAGADIWGTADQFNYVYQPITGDVDVSVRINSITFADKWSKAGVMIRESLAAGSAQASAFVSAGRGYAFQRRLVTGGTSVSTAGTSSAPPGWLRLTRSGSLVSAYQSTDGQSWTAIGSDSIPMAATVYVGIAATSHSTTAATDVSADTLTIAQASPSANQPPTVSITSPASGATFTAPATITIAANAADPENQLTRVEFYNGTALLGSAAAAPYSFTWSSVPAGTYSLSAVAYDAGGASTRSTAVSVTVSAANQPPTVSLTSPANGAAFVAPASISIAANAADPENQLARVEFYNGSALLATDTTAPYAFTWSSVPAGSYTLTAVAYDAAGASTRSAAVSVSVGSAANQPPTVSLTSPANGASFTAPASISIAANAADPENQLSRVEFLQRHRAARHRHDGAVLVHLVVGPGGHVFVDRGRLRRRRSQHPIRGRERDGHCHEPVADGAAGGRHRLPNAGRRDDV
jgi:regulation of enolase protein 1 (concanavalin A-like superfamily)